MVSCGIIEKFIVRVNPAGFGYRTAQVLMMRNNGITKEDVTERTKQFGDLAYHVHHISKNFYGCTYDQKNHWMTKLHSH